MRLRFLLVPFVAALPASAAPRSIAVAPAMFSEPKFVREFVGSYGILSDIEPRVSSEEQELLGKVREWFEQSRFQEAEAAIAGFMDGTNRPRRRNEELAEVSPALIFVLGNLYFQAGRPEDARKRFLEAIEKFPRFRRAHTNLGYLYVSQNKLELALPMLQRAVELGESSGRVFGLIGYCHLTAGNPLAAENAYRQAYLLDPRARDWKLGLAQALVGQEKHTEAIAMIGSLIRENPNDKSLWLQQANSYLAIDRKADAILNLEILRRKGLADEGNLALLGNLHMDAGEPGLALSAYRSALERSAKPDVGNVLKSARILCDYGSPKAADELLTALRGRTALDPKSAGEAALTEVRIARALGDNGRISRVLEDLLAKRPADPEVLVELARHKDMLSRDMEEGDARDEMVRDARTNYQLALRDAIQAYPAHLGLGQMLVREKRFEDALPHLEAALQAKPSDSLKQYVSRVRRAADRAKQIAERESKG